MVRWRRWRLVRDLIAHTAHLPVLCKLHVRHYQDHWKTRTSLPGEDYSTSTYVTLHVGHIHLEHMQVQGEAKYFQRFQDGWPIREFIKQYLANNQETLKRALREERRAEANDTDDWSASAQIAESSDENSESDGDAVSDDPDAVEDQEDLDAEEAGSDPSDEAMELDESEVVPSPVRAQSKAEKVNFLVPCQKPHLRLIRPGKSVTGESSATPYILCVVYLADSRRQ
jgi:hypothetical protein